MRTRPSIPASRLSSILPAVFLGLILSFTPAPVKADVLCTQFGFDTFQVGSTVEFEWSDNQAVPIGSFNLDLFCFENGKLLKTLATLNASTSVSPQSWTVDNSILSFHNDCPLNQYQGVFDWTTTDPTTGATGTGSSKCKAMLLNGPGVIPAPGAIDPSQQPQDEDPSSGPVVISDRTKTIVIGVGCAVGALVLAGFIGFYYIRIKNKRAEQDLANKKLREPLQATNHDNHHAPGPPGSGGIASDGSTIVEMTPVAGMGPPGTLVMEQERPISILTSSFSPPEDTYEKQQRVRQEQEQQVYEQQLRQQHLQQQLQHQQQMQMQQQQQTYGGYNGY
ncbi:hypothetical protein BGZ82_009635 [Podila clonocystis]|nr:hypothetical protein BGZ82_009635 [Podila clonocystis]